MLAMPTIPAWADAADPAPIHMASSVRSFPKHLVPHRSFNQYVYARFGIQLPHPSGMQAAAGTPVTDPQPGDLMANAGHAGIYIGNGLMIHAMNPIDGTKVTAVVPGMGYYRLLG